MSARVERALAAAAGIARAQGLPVRDPVVLADGQNVVLHLRPGPVVARVATMTSVLRPDTVRTFGREIVLAGALAAAGAAVLAPSVDLPPGPHVRGGLTVSFWRHVDISTRRPSAREAGRALGELHGVLAGLPADLLADGSPLDTPLEDLAAFAARADVLHADPVTAARAGELATALRPLVSGPSGLLHGDPHPGNLLATPDGWAWTDLEDCARGPLGWDLACLRNTRRLDGRAAVEATPWPMSEEDLAPFRWLRRLHVGAWWHVAALREPPLLEEARRLLADAVGGTTGWLGG